MPVAGAPAGGCNPAVGQGIRVNVDAHNANGDKSASVTGFSGVVSRDTSDGVTKAWAKSIPVEVVQYGAIE